MNIAVIFSQMLQLFMLIGLGYFLLKVHVIDETFSSKLTTFVLDVTIPFMMLSSALSITEYQSYQAIAGVFVIAIGLYLIMPVIGYLLAKLLRVPSEQLGLYIFMTEFSNIGFIGYPVMHAIFGNEAVFYTTIFNMIFNLFVYTIGIPMIRFGTSSDTSWDLKKLITPSMVACILSLILYLGRIHIPAILTNTFQTLGSMTTPLAMLIIGATLATIPVKEVVMEVRLYPYAFLKQVLLPIISYDALHRVIADPLILGVTLVCIAMPVATSAVLFSKKYGTQEKLAAKAVFMTTLLSILTIPLICGLFLK